MNEDMSNGTYLFDIFNIFDIESWESQVEAGASH